MIAAAAVAAVIGPEEDQWAGAYPPSQLGGTPSQGETS